MLPRPPISTLFSANVITEIKAKLADVDAALATQQMDAVLTKMKVIMHQLAAADSNLLADKNWRDAIELVSNKCKKLENEFPDIGSIYIAHAIFLQKMGRYDESYYPLGKMNDFDTTHPEQLKMTDAERVIAYDLQAKLYLRNGAILGAQEVALKALQCNPQHESAKMVLTLCERATVYNEKSHASLKTWIKGCTFAYLTLDDDKAMDWLGIKSDETKRPANLYQPIKPYANNPFSFLASRKTVKAPQQELQPKRLTPKTIP